MNNKTFNIMHGDCLIGMKSMSSNSIDCIITSPPYNLKNKKAGAITINYNTYDDNMSNEDYAKWQIEFLNECFRILKPDGNMFYNHKARYEKGVLIHPLKWVFQSELTLYQQLVWETNRKVEHGKYRFVGNSEYIFWLKKTNQISKMSSAYLASDIIHLGRSERHNTHPAAFPVKVPALILDALYRDSEPKVILDPFMGSGTVGVVSNYFNHHFIGIELDEFYIQMTQIRMEDFSDLDKQNIDTFISSFKVKKPYKLK